MTSHDDKECQELIAAIERGDVAIHSYEDNEQVRDMDATNMILAALRAAPSHVAATGETPRTDEAFPPRVYDNAKEDGWEHAIDYARQLERELAIAKKRLIAEMDAPPSSTRQSTQEFAWLIEKREHVTTFYWTGTVADGGFWKWTANAHEAVRFPTKAAAEESRLHLKLYNDYPEGDPGHLLRGHNGCEAVEHGFIYAPPSVETNWDQQVDDMRHALELDMEAARSATGTLEAVATTAARSARNMAVEDCARMVDKYNDTNETGDLLTMLAENMRSMKSATTDGGDKTNG